VDETGGDRPIAYDHNPAALARFIADLHIFLAEIPDPKSQDGGRVSAATRDHAPRRQSFRTVLLDGLQDLGYPTTSRTLGKFVAARFGRAIPATQFGTLAAQERRAFSRQGPESRSIWLCHGVRVDFHPIKRILARSDWPLAWRIVAPTSGRVQFLRATERLCQLAMRAEDTAKDSGALMALALAHARDLPGVGVDDREPDFAKYAAVARNLLSELEPEDLRLRQEASVRLQGMPDGVQLFGVDRFAEPEELDHQRHASKIL
jgi:hypothetical protein